MVGEVSEDGDWVWDGSKWISKQEYELPDDNNYNEQSNTLNRIRTYLIIKLVSIFSIPIFTISWMKKWFNIDFGQYDGYYYVARGYHEVGDCRFYLFKETRKGHMWKADSVGCSHHDPTSYSSVYAPNFEYLEYALNISLILISVMFSVLLMNIFKKTNTDTKSGQFGKFIQNKSLPNGFVMIFYFVSSIVIILTTYSILQIHRFSGNNGLNLEIDVDYYLMIVTALWMFSFSLYIKKSNTNTHTLTKSLSKLRSKSRDEIANGENAEIAQSENALPGTTIIYNITDSVISGDINNPIQGIKSETHDNSDKEINELQETLFVQSVIYGTLLSPEFIFGLIVVISSLFLLDHELILSGFVFETPVFLAVTGGSIMLDAFRREFEQWKSNAQWSGIDFNSPGRPRTIFIIFLCIFTVIVFFRLFYEILNFF